MLLAFRMSVYHIFKMAKHYRDMKSILEYVLEDSDEEPDLGEDDNDRNDIDSDWEYEEEDLSFLADTNHTASEVIEMQRPDAGCEDTNIPPMNLPAPDNNESVLLINI